MALIVTTALLLRQTDRGEDDRWVSLLSPDLGAVSALARRARGSARRFGAALQPFVLVEARLRRSRSRGQGPWGLEDLKALEHPLGADPGLETLAAAWAFLELAEQCCAPGQAQPAFFELALGGLRRLGRGAEPVPAVRLSVLWGALELEGWAPDLDACAACGSASPWPDLALDPARGGLLCPDCRAPGQPALPDAVRQAWQAASQGRPLPLCPPQAEAALLAWLEHQTGRPLRAARFDPAPPRSPS